MYSELYLSHCIHKPSGEQQTTGVALEMCHIFDTFPIYVLPVPAFDSVVDWPGLFCCWSGLAAGHVVMDEDLERTVLVVNLGVIPPMETVSILVSTSSELSTLADGGIRVCSPSVCTPKVQRTVNEEQGLSPNFTRT